MPINGETGVFSDNELHGNKPLGEISNLGGTAQKKLAMVKSVFAESVGDITDDSTHNSENNDSTTENDNGSSLIDARLQLFDGDTLKDMLETYILFQNLTDDKVRKDRQNFYLSNFHSHIHKENLQDLGIYNVNLFKKEELGLLCWVLYGEPSNEIIQYQAELQQQ